MPVWTLDPKAEQDHTCGMVEPENVFVTIAFQYKTGGFPPAGFFCLWDDELTFVHSRWMQFVAPIPLIGPLLIWMLPIDPRPTGPQDKRTRTRVPFVDITSVNPRRRQIEVHTRVGTDFYFGGGSLNRAFRFKLVAAEIAKALQAVGFTVDVTNDALTVKSGAR
jgi:hypothetical protein